MDTKPDLNGSEDPTKQQPRPISQQRIVRALLVGQLPESVDQHQLQRILADYSLQAEPILFLEKPEPLPLPSIPIPSIQPANRKERRAQAARARAAEKKGKRESRFRGWQEKLQDRPPDPSGRPAFGPFEEERMDP